MKVPESPRSVTLNPLLEIQGTDPQILFDRFGI